MLAAAMWGSYERAEICRRLAFLLLAALVRVLAALYEVVRGALGRGASAEPAAARGA